MGGWVSGQRGEKEEGRLEHNELPAKVMVPMVLTQCQRWVVGTLTMSAGSKMPASASTAAATRQALFWPFHGSTFLILTIIPGDRF